MKEVLFVLLHEFADWEAAPLAAAINQIQGFRVRTVSLTKEPVVSIGGFSVNPDYDLPEAMLSEFAGLILIGGNSWRTEEAKQVAALVEIAIKKNAVVAGICDGSVFLGAIGALNTVEHTSNELEDLQSFAGEIYTGSGNYRLVQAVRCGNLVTANGSANLEFAREVLRALHAVPDEEIEEWYRFFKLGYYEAMIHQE